MHIHAHNMYGTHFPGTSMSVLDDCVRTFLPEKKTKAFGDKSQKVYLIGIHLQCSLGSLPADTWIKLELKHTFCQLYLKQR